jgi:hypothetical protein
VPRRAVPLALALLLSPAVPPLSAGPALAANGADFTLKNQTGRQIDEAYVSAHSSKRWGKEVMGEDTLDAGQSVKITFPGSNSACMFDITVKYRDNDVKAEWSNIDLCKHSAITLCMDKRNRVTRAVGE